MAGCFASDRYSGSDGAGVSASSTGVGVVLDEHAGGGGLLDVLAYDHSADSGVDPRRRVRTVEHVSAGWDSGWVADRWGDRWICLRTYRTGWGAAD